MKLPEDLRLPAGGENIDRTSREAIRLAYDALDRFPGLVRRHKFIAGGAALSSAITASTIALAVALAAIITTALR